jgi:VIT1/CCC1 family predicted Fe2+/Mn2+ transporter
MRISIQKGLGFGLTSGIITTIGLIVGLYSSTRSAPIVIGGILVIAVADALGIHISEEAEIKHSTREIWESTITTFISKFVFALTFIVPILLFSLYPAIIVSVAWGLSLIATFSFYIAKQQKTKPHKVIIEHLVIAILVIVVTYFVGSWISTFSRNW